MQGARIKGRLGRPDRSDPNDCFGLYQMRRCKRGTVPIRIRFYDYVITRTPAQQEKRAKFRDAVAAWQGASEDVKSEFNHLAKSYHMSGYNLFLRRFMMAL